MSCQRSCERLHDGSVAPFISFAWIRELIWSHMSGVSINDLVKSIALRSSYMLFVHSIVVSLNNNQRRAQSR